MSTVIFIVAIVAIMIFFNALYVGAEFATVASRKTRINQLAAEGSRPAQLLLPIVQDSHALDRYVAACQIGITISSLVLGAFGQSAIASRLGEPLSRLLQTAQPVLVGFGMDIPDLLVETAAFSLSAILVLATLTVLQVMLGELFPKSVAVQYPEKVSLAVIYPMLISLRLLKHLITFFNGSANVLLRLMGREIGDVRHGVHSPEEIEILMTESHEVGFLDEIERQMLRNALRMRELTARQVMLHRTKLVAAPADSGIVEVMELALEAGFSRIPLYKESIDNIVGFVHIKDLFRLHVQGNDEIQSIIRDVTYVPESLPVSRVWKILDTKRKYLAVVFDEYGGTAGLLTFEDLIEEIFGELQDEFDDETKLVARGDKEGRIYYLRGDLLVSDVNEYLKLALPTEADTLSGLAFSTLGRAPEVGDELLFEGATIQIEKMEDLGVAEVSLTLALPQMGPLTEWEVAEYD
ncbi:MAG: hemolysin family protein [Chloroflexota bacterium]|jgi:putative hemolysin